MRIKQAMKGIVIIALLLFLYRNTIYFNEIGCQGIFINLGPCQFAVFRQDQWKNSKGYQLGFTINRPQGPPM